MICYEMYAFILFLYLFMSELQVVEMEQFWVP